MGNSSHSSSEKESNHAGTLGCGEGGFKRPTCLNGTQTFEHSSDAAGFLGRGTRPDTKHHLSSPENENNVLTITGAAPLTTACLEFQDKGDVNVFTAHFPQSREYSANKEGREGRGKPGLSNPFY